MDVKDIDIALVVDNELSVNEEDTYTFNRLKAQLEKYGMMELPVVREDGEGKYRVISGHHRIRAWNTLGHSSVKVVVAATPLQNREEEFNLVNNFNTIRGTIRKQTLIGKVREYDLDVKKLDIFKFPVNKLFPLLSCEDMQQGDDDQRRKAKINELTLVIAKEIAKAVYDARDEMVSVICVKDKAAAILRLPFKSGAIARERADELKKAIRRGIEGTDISG